MKFEDYVRCIAVSVSDEKYIKYENYVIEEYRRLKKALDLALYYIEGDATYEAVKEKIDKILTGIEPKEKK